MCACDVGEVQVEAVLAEAGLLVGDGAAEAGGEVEVAHGEEDAEHAEGAGEGGGGLVLGGEGAGEDESGDDGGDVDDEAVEDPEGVVEELAPEGVGAEQALVEEDGEDAAGREQRAPVRLAAARAGELGDADGGVDGHAEGDEELAAPRGAEGLRRELRGGEVVGGAAVRPALVLGLDRERRRVVVVVVVVVRGVRGGARAGLGAAAEEVGPAALEGVGPAALAPGVPRSD